MSREKFSSRKNEMIKLIKLIKQQFHVWPLPQENVHWSHCNGLPQKFLPKDEKIYTQKNHKKNFEIK